jgi:hypothetical protein
MRKCLDSGWRSRHSQNEMNTGSRRGLIMKIGTVIKRDMDSSIPTTAALISSPTLPPSKAPAWAT